MQMIAARQAQRAMFNAFQAEQSRQAGYRNQAFGTLGEAIPQRGVETARSQMAEGAQHRRDSYENVNQAELGIGGKGQTARDKANYSLQGDARAKLGSYSDWQLRQMVQHIRTQDKLNKISNFAGGNAGVFPYVMQDAQHQGDTLAAMGQLVAAAGGTATSFNSLFNGGAIGGSPGIGAPGNNGGLGGPQFGSIYPGAGGSFYQSSSSDGIPNGAPGGGYSRPL